MFTGGVRFYTAVVFLIQYCSCLSYLFLVSPDVVSIGSEYFVVYLSCVYIYFEVYVRLIMSSYLFFFVSASMFGIAHAIQNEKRLWNLHIG